MAPRAEQSPRTMQSDLKRARIVLLAADGMGTRAIAKEVGVQPLTRIGFNFREGSTGNQCLRIRVQNDTDYDGIGDSWVTVWDGSTNILDVNHPINFQGASISGDDGGYTKIEIDLVIPRTGIGISNTASEIIYMGQLRLWFTSIAF